MIVSRRRDLALSVKYRANSYPESEVDPPHQKHWLIPTIFITSAVHLGAEGVRLKFKFLLAKAMPFILIFIIHEMKSSPIIPPATKTDG